MFMVFNKEKILSYLISLSTVALLFVLSFAITKRNDEILKTSANAILDNSVESSTSSTTNNLNTEIIDTDSGLNPNANRNLIQTQNPNAQENIVQTQNPNAQESLDQTQNPNAQENIVQTQNPNAQENLDETQNPNAQGNLIQTQNPNITRTDDKSTDNT